jgi:hypothetical protein
VNLKNGFLFPFWVLLKEVSHIWIIISLGLLCSLDLDLLGLQARPTHSCNPMWTTPT